MARPFVRALCVLVALLAAAPVVFARPEPVQVAMELSDSRVYVGEAVKLQIQIKGIRSAEQPTIPDVPGLEIRYESGQDVSHSSTVIINGRRRDESYEAYIMQFEVVPMREGSFTIPPVAVRVNGEAHATNSVTLTAVPAQEDRDVKLRIESDNPSPYVGEPIRLKVTLGLARAAAGAAFAFPGVEAKFQTVEEPALIQRLQNQPMFTILGAEVPAKETRAAFDGESLAAYFAERVLIPREAGRITIGPATATVDVIIKRAMSIFDRDHTRRAVVPSNALTLDIRPLPTEGRPANFIGLIGKYRLAARAAPAEVNVGDPITLTIRVEGPLAAGVQSPAIERQANLVEGFRVAAETAPGVLEGSAKVFTRVLRAQRADVSQIPPIELPYFDSTSGRYEVARSEPIPLRVRETRVVTAADAEGGADSPAPASKLEVEERPGGLRFNYEGPALLRDHSFDLALAFASPATLTVLAAPPAAMAAVVGLAAIRRRAAAHAPATRRRRALADARDALDHPADDPASVATSVSAALRGYVAAKFDRAGETLTGREAAELVRAAVPDAADPLASILGRCEAALYGGLALTEARRMRQDALDWLDRADRAIGRNA
jgi:hypothetical protein